ncbi:MAG: multicomponent Na+:H+ antiporter subunit G [Alphaproteobacteria bacterium]|nr:multicomponent Na+:H+ antiporter subunit G [Alphaproteobacteria bacterium]
MQFILDSASWLLILAGGGFILTGAIGVIRMPDFYTRLHAAGMTDTMGASLFLAGMLLQTGLGITSLKLILLWVFILFTSPIATHALINAAFSAKLGMAQIDDRTDGKSGGAKS